VSCNASTDMVTVQMNLCTTGDPSIHRLLSIVLRYCLKSGRMDFENMGFQVPIISYTTLLPSEQTELEWESTYTIEGKFTDSWIDREYLLNDDTDNIDLHVIAVPVNPNNEVVPIG
jgi:hypothetical protein